MERNNFFSTEKQFCFSLSYFKFVLKSGNDLDKPKIQVINFSRVLMSACTRCFGAHFLLGKESSPSCSQVDSVAGFGKPPGEGQEPSRCFESLTPSLQPFSWQEREEKPGKVEFSKGISWSNELDF